MSEKDEFTRFTISLPNDLFQSFEDFRTKSNLSRSDAIRKAMWDYTQKQTASIRTLSEEHVTAIIIIYMTHAYPGEKHNHDQLSAEEHSKMHQNVHIQSDHREHHDHLSHLEDTKLSRLNDKGSEHDEHEIIEILNSTYFTYPDTDLIKINHLEHLFHDIVLTQLHIHADHEKCIVIIPVKGSGIRINELYRNVIQLKSILSHQLIIEE